MQQEGSRVLERRPLQSQQLLAVAGGRLSMEVGSVDLDLDRVLASCASRRKRRHFGIDLTG